MEQKDIEKVNLAPLFRLYGSIMGAAILATGTAIWYANNGDDCKKNEPECHVETPSEP